MILPAYISSICSDWLGFSFNNGALTTIDFHFVNLNVSKCHCDTHLSTPHHCVQCDVTAKLTCISFFLIYQKFGSIRADVIEQMRFKQRLRVIQTIEDTTKRNVVRTQSENLESSKCIGRSLIVSGWHSASQVIWSSALHLLWTSFSLSYF